MPIGIALIVINVALVVHAAKTGRFSPWGYVILMLPGVGGIAYVIVEILPEWLRGAQGQQARRKVMSTLDPEKRYRSLSDDLAIADTIAHRAALADECLAIGRPDEALRHYDEIIRRPNGDDPAFHIGKARAEMALDRPDAAWATLDALKRQWPRYDSREGHLLFARSLDGLGRADEALDEYEALSRYYPGPEPRARRAALLARLGRRDEARVGCEAVLTDLRRSPKHVRTMQKEWGDLARATLDTL